MAQVLVPLPLDVVYSYRVPASLPLTLGDIVLVPLGRRQLPGVVWEVASPDAATADRPLKTVIARLPVPPVPVGSRRFLDWVAAYTMTPRGALLRMMFGALTTLTPPMAAPDYRLTGQAAVGGFRLTGARQRILSVLAANPSLGATELLAAADCGPAVLRQLVAAGLVERVSRVKSTGVSVPDPDHGQQPTLSDGQRKAAEALLAGGVTLLDGVTGSGKTLVYLEGIARVLAAGQQVLVLLPEIALAGQVTQRFTARFGVRPLEWHSGIGTAARRMAWPAIASGAARLVVGARSALFLPYPNLGLIVVDEEHEVAFKQEEGALYHARDMAVARGHIERVPVVLVSATPSLETLTNVANGRYRSVLLPERHGVARLPTVKAIDMRRTPPARGRWLSPPLVAAVAQTLEQGEQALLFLNRRGYAPLTLCRSCGFRLGCPNCTAWMVEHRASGYLICHHCGHRLSIPPACPACEKPGSMVACGPGVERVHEEAVARFPGARVAVVASDTLSSPTALHDMLASIADRQFDLIIGTQVMAKGHHFPWLTLVGVVDADLGLAGGDPRAAERTFQLLQQAAGRAGREDRPGTALIQTHMPEHPVMRALVAGNRDGFLAAEGDARHQAGLPPFGRLAALILSGTNEPLVDETALRLARAAPRVADITILGPAPAPLALLRGHHRRRFLIKAPRRQPLQPVVASWLASVRLPSGVRLKIDIDPYGFL